MISLEDLLGSHPVDFYGLVMKCRDRNYQFFGNTGEILKQYSLVQSDGNVHASIRNVVLSAVVGEELDMTLGSPVAHINENR